MAITTPEVHYGTGRHLEFLTDEQQAMSVKLDWVSQAFHITSTSVAKISIVLFIRQIIGNGQRTMVFLYGMVGTLCAVSALCIAFIFAQCTPTAALWDPRLAATAKCWSPKVQQDLGYFIACENPLMASMPPVAQRRRRGRLFFADTMNSLCSIFRFCFGHFPCYHLVETADGT